MINAPNIIKLSISNQGASYLKKFNQLTIFVSEA